MPSPRRILLEEAVTRPGTYFNPQTEMLLVVDDGAAVDREVFRGQELDEEEWVLVDEEAPVDETARDELLERFESRHHPGASGAVTADEDDVEDDEDELEPDPDFDEEVDASDEDDEDY